MLFFTFGWNPVSSQDALPVCHLIPEHLLKDAGSELSDLLSLRPRKSPVDSVPRSTYLFHLKLDKGS